jgi:hypothetical protein
MFKILKHLTVILCDETKRAGMVSCGKVFSGEAKGKPAGDGIFFAIGENGALGAGV